MALAVLLTVACRDEQAGPRPKGQTQSSTSRPKIYDAPPANLPYPSSGTWANGTLAYLGSRLVPPQATPGQALVFTHYFQVRRTPPSGFKIFAHLLDRQTGAMLANLDHDIPGLPVEAWPVGKVVEDVHGIVVPAQAPAQMVLVLGFWKGDERLSVDPPGSIFGENRMLGPPVELRTDQLPEYHVRKTKKPPKIDGLLDDRVWTDAQPVRLRNSFDGRETTLKTMARLLYDDKNLYVSFDCEDPDVWGTMKNRDDPIYNEEVVEIFIDADGDGRTYNEIEVSPNNTLFDAYFPARRQGMDTSWDSGAKTAVHVRGTLNDPSDKDEGWSVEMAIPIRRLAEVPHVPPRPGDRWRFNLYRLEHLQRKTVEGQAFSPLYVGDFHHLPRFGWLIFDG